jgi:AraC family transcriptional regulator
LVKIAVDHRFVTPPSPIDREPSLPEAKLLAGGSGWAIHDVVCTAGPADRAFEEQHSQSSVAVVVSGTFQYRTSTGYELMTPGSLLLGNRGETFACGHEHGIGDRCISFHYSDEFREQAGVPLEQQQFRVPRIPAIPALSPLVANAATLLRRKADHAMCEEVALQVFDRATRLQHGVAARQQASNPSALARVTRVLRAIESEPGAPHELSDMAANARLSPYHFLRCFEHLTGVTPRQYLLRTRLRRAAIRLKVEPTKIIEIALNCGFGDVSNFNRAFRAEFGKNPRAYRCS